MFRRGGRFPGPPGDATGTSSLFFHATPMVTCINIQDFYSHLHEYLVKPGSAEVAAKPAQVGPADVCSSSESNDDLSASQTRLLCSRSSLSRQAAPEQRKSQQHSNPVVKQPSLSPRVPVETVRQRSAVGARGVRFLRAAR